MLEQDIHLTESFLNGIGDGLWDWNLITNEVHFSDAWKSMLGFQPDELQGSLDEWKTRVHPDDLDRTVKDIEHYLAGETSLYSNKHRLQHKLGHYVWVLDRGFVIERNHKGEPTRLVGTHADISEIKQLEKSLGTSLHTLSQVSDNVPGMIYTFRINPDGSSCFPYASDHIDEIYGVQPNQVKEDASLVYERLFPDDLSRVSQSILDSAQSLNVWKEEYRVNHPEKGLIWVSGQAMPEKQADGSVLWYGSIHDVTNEKKAHDFALQSMRYSVMDDMMLMLSHQFRQPLSVISMHVSMMNMQFKSMPELQSCSERFLKQLDKIRDMLNEQTSIIDQMDKRYLKPTAIRFSLQEKIAESMGRLKNQFSTLNIDLKADANNPEVMACPTLIEQILIVVVKNSVEQGYERSISSVHVYVTVEQVGDCVVCCVNDNAGGIENAHLHKVFEPYFTTKNLNGRGLGLYYVKHMVEDELKGMIRVQNLDEGLSIEISMPRVI